MRYLRLVRSFAALSAQEETAYRANFYISMLHSLMGLMTGVLGILVLFGQVETVNGWSLPAVLTLLGVYLTLGGLRNLVIGPSLEALAGMGGEIWTGTFDFTLLRPVPAQFLASVRKWRPLALFDLALGLGVLLFGVAQLDQTLSAARLFAFLVTLAAAVAILYAILLALSALVLWRPTFIGAWVFDGMFQMARYPVGLYPGWLRLVLTWIVPVGVMTTVPAEALTGTLSTGTLLGAVALAVALVVGASALFQAGLRRYASASS